ncbi:MAG: acyl-CoA dehydrogenase C-terminal domain-containing protein, partial [Endozoicomonas sp.]
FVMYDVFNVAEQWFQWPAVREAVDAETANAILEEAAKLATRTIHPLNRSGDEEGCTWENGNVSTPIGYKEAYKIFAEGGWNGLGGNPIYGGMGMPKVLATQFDEMACSASLSFTLYPSLGAGAALAIDAHASTELKATYLPKMYSGEWSGTMCLTEPHAGTDLGIIHTKAENNSDGSYNITGTKIFITGGEHDLTENIIHLVLAKLPDAPKGPKGISLFLVPKFMVNDDSSLGEKNGVACGSIEHKMGINGSATCVMNFDSAKGYLIGEVNKGLNAMFTMMNYERLFVGIQGLGSSEMSYQTALEYAKDRTQGRAATGVKNKEKAADPLLVHGDIRRMLSNMKALNEGGRAFSTYIAKQLDIAKYSVDAAENEKASALVALLTPVVKAFLTDAGLESCIAGQQILGGHGYIREWGQEQLVRDCRITQIYEGTNGIQALDLLGRKIAMNDGAYLEVFLKEIRSSISADDQFGAELLSAVDKLEDLTQKLLSQTKNNPNLINAACVDYLNAFAYISYGWMWFLMAKKASEKLLEGTDEKEWMEAKLITARYYFKRLLPRFESAALAALSGTEELYELGVDQF